MKSVVKAAVATQMRITEECHNNYFQAG